MATKSAVYEPRLQARYRTELKAELAKQLKLENANEVPSLEKVVVSVGTGRAKEDNRTLEAVENTLRKITGQHPASSVARKSIAGFKLREGQKIGYYVTLRGGRMYDFVDRLITIVLPRIRDFHGVNPQSFDRDGNYSLGLREQSVFPELGFEDTNVTHGLQITFVTTTKEQEQSRALLAALGMPFEKEKGSN